MFLKRIELQGFKSFADKSIITFDSDVTGIVGPNGCGKSNINDAIRWVLGEQSVKSLRGGSSMSDIIFSGSAQRKAVNLAEVTLVFDNTRRFFDVAYDEVEITRRLHRQNNEAEYLINKTPCRLKDITDLVMDTGLGRDSLSIITQGNISSFAEAKPEERRALFEEAAGVAKYKKRKNTSLSKLKNTQENLSRLEDIILELERQVNPLRRQAKKADQYLKYKEELSRIEINVIVDEIERLNTQIAEMEKERFELDSRCAMQQTTIQVQDVENEEQRKEMYALDREINQLQGEYSRAMDESARLERRKVELDEKRKYALEHANAKERARELRGMLEEAKFEYEDRRKRKADMDASLALARKQIASLEEEAGRSRMELESAQELYQRLLNRRDVLKNLMKEPYTHQQGVRSVMNAKASLPGIEGVVSELLGAMENYENAISNALGGAMYHIVSADERAARGAIAFLKKNRGGRATFLPMSVLKPRYVAKEQLFVAQHCEGFLGCASEFVEYDMRYDILAKALLGNVLVCDQLEHANELAKRLHYGFKIVTLDGDIVHRGGSMTGGTTKNATTPVNVQRELRQVNENLEGQYMKVSDLRAQFKALSSKRENQSTQMVQLQIAAAQLDSVLQVKRGKYESLLADYEQIAPENRDEEEQSVSLDDELIAGISALHSRIDELNTQMRTKRERRMKAGSEVERREQSIRALRRELAQLQTQMQHLDVESAKAQTRLENMIERLNTDYEMTVEYAQTQRTDIDMAGARERVRELRSLISALGNVNLDAPREFEEINERYTFLTAQRKELQEASNKILKAIDEMDEVMVRQFSEMFTRINKELDGVFKALFGGGCASLVMVDPDDVLNTGIDIDVQPPGKLVKNIRTFSGGEKALIAISVLFAILKARTMPLCVFDEVEAALDQANVERFARYLNHFRGESQFIVVTHRPGTMEQCDTLYGVTMQQNGVSTLLKVQLQDAMEIVDKEKEEVKA